jgi:RNA-binding protein
MVELTTQEKRELKEAAHALKPVVIVGANGITPALLQEVNLALEAHELIKIRLNSADREEQEEMTGKICKATLSTLVQAIGHIIAIYRKSQTQKS